MKTITRKVLASLLLTVLVVLGGWGYLEIRSNLRFEQERILRRKTNIVERLAYSLVYPVWNLNLVETEKIIQNEAVNENVQAILVYDESGTLYAGEIREGAKGEDIKTYNANSPLHRRSLLQSKNSETREIIKKGKAIGKVTLYVNDSHLQSIIRQETTTIVFKMLGLIAALACVQFLVLRKFVIKPLILLKGWVMSIGSGQPPPLPQMSRCEEIDVLAVSFSEMAGHLTRSKEEQEKNHHLLRSIMDNTFQLQGLLSPDGKVIDVNATALGMINASKESVLGKNFWDTPWWNHDPALSERVRQAVERAAKGELIRFEGMHIDALGELHYIDCSVKPVSDEAGNIIYLIPEGRDITERKQGEEALRASEERNRTILETAMDGFWRLDMQGRLLEVNEAYCRMSGYSKDELLALSIADLEAKETPTDTVAHIQNIRVQGEERFETRHRRKDGSFFEVEVSVQHKPVERGQMVCFLRDITERKRAEEALQQSEDKFRLAFQTSPDAININRLEDDRYVDINQGFIDLTGFTREEVIGRTPLEINIWHVPVDRERLAQGLREGGYIENLEAQFRRKDGSLLTGLLSARLLRLGGVPHILSITRDITERKRAEKEIQRLLAQVQQNATELEKRVAERTDQLKTANTQLEAFAYSVSHDLKAPLRGIDGYSRLLLEDYASKMDADGQLFVKNIRLGVSQMTQLIDDLLAYSRLERRTLVPGGIKLPNFVESLLRGYDDEIRSRQIALTVSLPPKTIQADADGLGLALRNIIENALKFTRNTAKPTIEITGREKGKCYILQVRDNGIGFDMGYQDRIFEIFHRLQRAEDYPGTGIGLALVRKAMERIGGRVWAESKPGEGTSFFLEVPIE